MPAYSFKERFCSMILDGTKSHTIRANRKGSGHAKPGQKVYLYFGMRTKHCRKLGEGTCETTREIMIHEEFILFRNKNGKSYMKIDGTDADQLAWRDGFRPDGSTYKKPLNAFEVMVKYWKLNGGLPFVGHIIYWKEFVPDLTSHLLIQKIKS